MRIGVLEERSRTGQVSYRFAHAFFRQTLYEEMIAPRRLRLHQEVARALESQYGARREEHAAELAEHFAESTDKADLAKAVEYGELAAQRAMSVYAYAEAASHLERCLAVQEVLDPDDKAKRCDLLLALGEALLPIGEPLRVSNQVCQEAFSKAESLGDAERASRAAQLALEGIWRFHGLQSPEQPAWGEWATREDGYARPNTPQRVRADAALGQMFFRIGETGRGRSLIIRAMEQAGNFKDSELWFQMAWRRQVYLRAVRDLGDAVSFAEAASERSIMGVSPRTVVLVWFYSAMVLLRSGNYDSAKAIWQRMRDLADRSRDVNLLIYPLFIESGLRNHEGSSLKRLI